MSDRPIALVFDVDTESLTTIRQAFPSWQLEVFDEQAALSLTRKRDLEAVALLVVGSQEGQVSETLGLCRVLRRQAGREQTPLLVLVPPSRQGLVRAALEA